MNYNTKLDTAKVDAISAHTIFYSNMHNNMRIMYTLLLLLINFNVWIYVTHSYGIIMAKFGIIIKAISLILE